jgi:ribonuclease HII
MICGIDEAGRGPLAGPVYVAAVVLGADGRSIDGITDSKKLSEAKRAALALAIKSKARAWSVVAIDEATIDSINILQATLLGMQRAYDALRWQPTDVGTVTEIIIDGTQTPRGLSEIAARASISIEARAKADFTVQEVGAASILAKTARDAFMIEAASRFPEYGFERHKGYGTKEHLAAIERFGPCPLHRRSFAPIAQYSLFTKSSD